MEFTRATYAHAIARLVNREGSRYYSATWGLGMQPTHHTWMYWLKLKRRLVDRWRRENGIEMFSPNPEGLDIYDDVYAILTAPCLNAPDLKDSTLRELQGLWLDKLQAGRKGVRDWDSTDAKNQGRVTWAPGDREEYEHFTWLYGRLLDYWHIHGDGTNLEWLVERSTRGRAV